MNPDELWGLVGQKANGLWLWLAVRRRTRQVVAATPADRPEDSARGRRARVPKDSARRASRADRWEAYRAVFARRTHRLGAKQGGQSCRVENFKGRLRQRQGRFVRRTLSFSKGEEFHEEAVHLFVAEHNLNILNQR